MASGQLAAARQLGHDLMKSSPRFNPAYDVLYRSYIQTGEIESAVAVLQAKVNNSQASLASLVELADHFAARNQWKDAEEVLQRIVNDKQTQDGPATAAAFYARYARHEKAIEHYRRAIQVKPASTAEFEKQIARSYMASNRSAEAMNTVESVLKRESADEDAPAPAGRVVAAIRL
jgi:tetratricopeptide (TPR) repeat protein